MAEVIGASDRAALAAVGNLPVLKVADLDADPLGMFRRYRAAYPFVRHENGGYLVLRHADVERPGNDPRTAATETMHPELYGVTEGALFDVFEQGMLTANGAVHRRRLLPARQFVILSTMSGARDEEAYERPDVFDIRRTDQPRLLPIFGAGAHRCIGEALARVELEESLAALAARIPHLQLDQAPTIIGHAAIRRVDTMRLAWQP
jgi:cytochrome P450